MSEFTFKNDRGPVSDQELTPRGAAETVVNDTPGTNGPETRLGEAELSFKDCPIKKLLGYMRAHSDVEVCGDVDISSSSADVFVKGKAGKRLVKELGLVFGGFDGNGAFVESDPANKGVSDLNGDGDVDLTENMHLNDLPSVPQDEEPQISEGDSEYDSSTGHQVVNLEAPDSSIDVTAGDQGWYLRVLRADGDTQYIPVQPINDIVNGVQAANSVTSILGMMQEMGALQEAIRQVAAESYQNTENDADRLEARLDRDIRTLKAHLDSMEQSLVAYIAASDIETWNHIDAQLRLVTDELDVRHNILALHGCEDVTIGTECSDSAVALSFTSYEAMHSGLQNLEKWMIQVSIFDDAVNTLRHDIDLIASAEIDGDGKLKVTTMPISCADLDMTQPKVKVTALWCGGIQALPDTTPVILSDYVPSPLQENGVKDSDETDSRVFFAGSSMEVPVNNTGGQTGYAIGLYSASGLDASALTLGAVQSVQEFGYWNHTQDVTIDFMVLAGGDADQAAALYDEFAGLTGDGFPTDLDGTPAIARIKVVGADPAKTPWWNPSGGLVASFDTMQGQHPMDIGAEFYREVSLDDPSAKKLTFRATINDDYSNPGTPQATIASTADIDAYFGHDEDSGSYSSGY